MFISKKILICVCFVIVGLFFIFEIFLFLCYFSIWQQRQIIATCHRNVRDLTFDRFEVRLEIFCFAAKINNTINNQNKLLGLVNNFHLGGWLLIPAFCVTVLSYYSYFTSCPVRNQCKQTHCLNIFLLLKRQRIIQEQHYKVKKIHKMTPLLKVPLSIKMFQKKVSVYFT